MCSSDLVADPEAAFTKAHFLQLLAEAVVGEVPVGDGEDAGGGPGDGGAGDDADAGEVQP